jgi:hypothetical protein
VEPPEAIPGASLWLDDVRVPPPGWDWVKTVPEAIEALSTKEYKLASLDHDLGFHNSWDGQEGIALVEWMVQHDIWPIEACYVHSWNFSGADRMCALINEHGPYKTLVQPTPAIAMPYVADDDVPDQYREAWNDPLIG